MKRPGGCSISGSFGNSEIPLPLRSFYLFHEGETTNVVIALIGAYLDHCGRQSQVGSLAGAAHLLNDNTGVLG